MSYSETYLDYKIRSIIRSEDRLLKLVFFSRKKSCLYPVGCGTIERNLKI